MQAIELHPRVLSVVVRAQRGGGVGGEVAHQTFVLTNRTVVSRQVSSQTFLVFE